MKALLRQVDTNGFQYSALLFVCPGCVAGGPDGYYGLHLLPVNAPNIDKPSWDWDGNLEAPTLSPSILSEGYCRCHSYLKHGIFKFLPDSNHPLAGKEAPMIDLPDWVEDLYDSNDAIE